MAVDIAASFRRSLAEIEEPGASASTTRRGADFARRLDADSSDAHGRVQDDGGRPEGKQVETMPRTRAQRQHRLATALDQGTVSHILSYLPGLGATPGRVYTLTAPASTPTPQDTLSLKAVLAPRRSRVIKCPSAAHPSLEAAVAAARDRDVVLLTASVHSSGGRRP